jgi:hypothetical protein
MSLKLKDKTFGFLEVLNPSKLRDNCGRIKWACRCICGNITYVISSELVNGKSQSCGCRGLGYASKKDNFINKQFGFLVVSSFYGIDSTTHERLWNCLCMCSKETIVATTLLTRGNTKSCGCEGRGVQDQEGWSSKKDIIKRNFYSVWAAMKARCLNPLHKEFYNYGGRGIKVCDRWLVFLNFRDDMWEKYLQMLSNEEKPTIERLEVNGNYEPSNVEWATTKVQGKNKRISIRSINEKEYRYWKNKLAHNFSRVLSGIIKYKSPLLKEFSSLTLSEFKSYIESLFLPGMTWGNYGKGFGKWSLDHIIACNKFDLAIEEDRYRCFYYQNLKPMWWIDNIKKGGF